MLCEYGCNQDVRFELANGKWCCSSHRESCPEIIRKMIEKIPCDLCGKMIPKNAMSRHLLACSKYFCQFCGSPLDHKKKFCNSKCAAFFNNKTDALKNCKRGPKRESEKNCKCFICGEETVGGRKFCSSKCFLEHRYRILEESWLRGELGVDNKTQNVSGYVRRFLFKKYDSKCAECGWNKINVYTGKIPLQVHHIDGNSLNNRPNNVILLCPSCHSLTSNFCNRKRL